MKSDAPCHPFVVSSGDIILPKVTS